MMQAAWLLGKESVMVKFQCRKRQCYDARGRSFSSHARDRRSFNAASGNAMMQAKGGLKMSKPIDERFNAASGNAMMQVIKTNIDKKSLARVSMPQAAML